MTKSEIHLFIIWERGRYRENDILADMAKNFTILKQYAITWTPELIASNFTRFYGVNLPSQSDKEKECGTGEFLLCIVKDSHPKYEVRKTSHGLENVNINLFDKKSLYREWTGGGHKIHCTTNEKETNHDLTLLLGKNTEDLLDFINFSERESICKDIEGADGWINLRHLFYVLNNTISYCVLRNYECLPNEYDFTTHGDIDILTDNKSNAIYVTNAIPVYPAEPYRVYCNVLVDSKNIPFDFRSIGDNYYDMRWERNILDKKIVSKGGFFIPNMIDQYYSLLYHAYIQKYRIADDYPKKLSYLASAINENFKNDVRYVISQLDDFLKTNGYEYIKCEDKTVGYNQSILQLSKHHMRYGGPCIRTLYLSDYDKISNSLLVWSSKVFKKRESFIKVGTPWLIDNEKYILSQFNYPFVPKLVANGKDGMSSWIEISRVEGVDLDKFFAIRSNFTMKNIRGIIEDGLKKLFLIYKSGVMHRDVIPGNILVFKQRGRCVCNFIDFGSAIKYKENISFPSPQFLGERYAPEYMFSDFYSFGKVSLSICRKMPYLKRIANELTSIQWDNYQDEKYVEEIVEHALILCRKSMILRDYYAFYRKKYSTWRKYIQNPILILRKLLVRVKRVFHK